MWDLLDQGSNLCPLHWQVDFNHCATREARHCVLDKGELKQLLRNKAMDSRPGTSLLGCVSTFSSVTPHTSPCQSCCSSVRLLWGLFAINAGHPVSAVFELTIKLPPTPPLKARSWMFSQRLPEVPRCLVFSCSPLSHFLLPGLPRHFAS